MSNGKPAAVPSCRGEPPGEWNRGYYCAVATLLREEGTATPAVKSLFAQGGDPLEADPEDLELFRSHQLLR